MPERAQQRTDKHAPRNRRARSVWPAAALVVILNTAFLGATRPVRPHRIAPFIVSPHGLLPAISGHVVIWLQSSPARPRGRRAAEDLYGKDLATGRTFAITTGGTVAVGGGEGAPAIPAISGATVVWADCRACYSASGLPGFGGAQIYARNLATGHAYSVATARAGGSPWSPALSDHVVIWSQEGSQPGLYAQDLATGRQVLVVRGIGGGAVSDQTVVWLAQHRGRWTIDGKDLATGRAFSSALDTASAPGHRPSDLLLSGHRAVWTELQPDHSVAILAKDLATGHVTSVTAIPDGHYNPQYGPHVAFSGDLVAWDQAGNPVGSPTPNYDIFARDLRVGRTMRITTDAHDQLWPATNGKTIVWEDVRTGTWSVYGATVRLP